MPMLVFFANVRDVRSVALIDVRSFVGEPTVMLSRNTNKGQGGQTLVAGYLFIFDLIGILFSNRSQTLLS